MAELGSSDGELGFEDYGDDDFDGLEEFDFCFEETSPNAESQQIEVITTKYLLAAQRDDLLRLMDILPLKEHHARSLLIHYRWDLEKLLSVLVEKGKDELYAEAGLSILDHVDDLVSSGVICMICIDEVPADQVTTMECGHYFCNTCWTKHFISKINEGQSQQIRCMAYQCHTVCDKSKVSKLLSDRDPNLAEKFDHFLLESYIQDNIKVKWCPSIPHCGNAIRIDANDLCEVECACGLQFCFKCLSEVHSPCSCQMWEMWNKMCEGKSKTVKWIIEHTKSCPECHEPVEKDGGCNIITCVCGQLFCWICGRRAEIDHNCRGFEKEKQVETRCTNDEDVWHYIHSHHRYRDQTEFIDLEWKLKKALAARRFLYGESNSGDFCWVTDALERVSMARRIISFTYPFAYYMFGHILLRDGMTEQERRIKQNMFEAHQQQLKENVEMICSLLNEPFAFHVDNVLMKFRMQIVDHSAATDKLCRKLYDYIENDLLGSVQSETHNMAPYKSNGVERASEIIVYETLLY